MNENRTWHCDHVKVTIGEFRQGTDLEVTALNQLKADSSNLILFVAIRRILLFFYTVWIKHLEFLI